MDALRASIKGDASAKSNAPFLPNFLFRDPRAPSGLAQSELPKSLQLVHLPCSRRYLQYPVFLKSFASAGPCADSAVPPTALAQCSSFPEVAATVPGFQGRLILRRPASGRNRRSDGASAPCKESGQGTQQEGQCPEQCALGCTLRRHIGCLFGLHLCLGYGVFVLLLVLIHLSLRL